MVSIIIRANDETKKRAIAAGFVESSVLIRWEYGISSEKERQRRERDLMDEIHPYQFLVADYWGIRAD